MLVVRVNAFYTYAISLVYAVYIKFAFTIIINAYSLCKPIEFFTIKPLAKLYS